MNLKENEDVKTVNIFNVVEQLNNITEVVNGSASGNLSDIQLKNINDGIKNLKDKLSNLETDVNKYIDETELENALTEIKNNLSNSVKSNDFTNSINVLNTTISTINGKITELQNKENIDLTGFVKSSEVEDKINDILNNRISTIENNVLTTVNSSIENKMNTKINELNIDNKIGNIVDDKINNFEITFKANINNDLDDRFLNALNNSNNDYVKLNTTNSIYGINTFYGTTTFRNNVDIIGNITLPKLSKINSSIFTLNDEDIITEDTEKISIGTVGKNINLITDKLLLNGNEFNPQTQTYTLPNTVLHNNIENTLTEKLNGTKSNFNEYSLSNDVIIKKDAGNNLIIGKGDRLILDTNSLFIGRDELVYNDLVKKNEISNFADKKQLNTFDKTVTVSENVSIGGDLIVKGNVIDFSDKRITDKINDSFIILTEDEFNNLVTKDENKIYLIKE